MDEQIRALERSLQRSGQDVRVVPLELWNHIMTFLQKEMYLTFLMQPKQCRYCAPTPLNVNHHRDPVRRWEEGVPHQKWCRLGILLRALEDFTGGQNG